MPHAFKPYPKHPAVAYLTRLHADIGGRILENKRQAEKLAADAKASRLSSSCSIPSSTPAPYRPAGASPAIRGSREAPCSVAALDVLRTATAPMTVTEIAAAMLAAKGVEEPTRKQRLGIEAGVRCSLENNAGKGVERVGEGVPKRWKLI